MKRKFKEVKPTGSKGFFIDRNRETLPKIESLDITLGELARGFSDTSADLGGEIVSYADANGKPQLNIRPKFQRSYIVETKQEWQNALVYSVINQMPINEIHFGEIEDNVHYDEKYVLVDGQQRLLTLIMFINDELALKHVEENGKVVSRLFSQLSKEEKNAILNYKPSIKCAIGSERVLMDWFITINQENNPLWAQELRNAAYCGPFIESAKKYFSKSHATENSTVENGDILGNKNSKYYYQRYTSDCDPVRQDMLEFALILVAYRDFSDNKEFNGSLDDMICEYLRIHRNDENANDLVEYYKKVCDWIVDVFYHNDNDFIRNYSKPLYQAVGSQPWAELYHKYHNLSLTEEDKKRITERTAFYNNMGSSWYSDSKGVYEFVLRGEKEEDEVLLHLRTFKPADRVYMYRQQKGIDPIDGKHYELEEMQTHHIKAWRNGGTTTLDNLVMLSTKSHDLLHSGEIGITPEYLKSKLDELIKNFENYIPVYN